MMNTENSVYDATRTEVSVFLKLFFHFAPLNTVAEKFVTIIVNIFKFWTVKKWI